MKKDTDSNWLHNPLEGDNTLYYRRREGVAVEHMIRPAAYDMSYNHFHPEYEIYLLLHGKRQICYENRSYILEEGGLALIDSSRIHKTMSVPGDTDSYFERIILYVNKEKIEEYDRNFPELEMGNYFQRNDGIYTLSSEERHQTMQMFETVMQELDVELEKNRTLIDLTIIRFFINFWRLNKPTIYFVERPERQKKGKLSIAHEVSEYISAHFREQIPLEELAERFHVSESYLSRSFKDVVGFGIREYVNILRIRKAQEMLEDSELAVSDISEAVGFDSASYFGRVFQKHLAISPSQYRKDLFVRRSTERESDPNNKKSGT